MSAARLLSRATAGVTGRLWSHPAAASATSARHASSTSLSVQDDFYSEEQRGLQRTLQQIIDEHINPHVDEWEAKGEYPAHRVFGHLGRAGLLGINKPVEHGGLGLDLKFSVAMNETLGHIDCGAIPMSIAVQTDMATPALARFGNDHVKKNFLEPSIKGEQVACLGVSEPGAGSDVANIKTTAVRQGDDLVINGQKMWITNAFQADWMCLLVNTVPDAPSHRNKSLVCLPMDTPGITLAKKLDKLGMRSSDTAVIYFEDVRVPATNIVGEEGQGFTYQMLQFQEERLAAVALSLLPLDRVINETIEYTRSRHAFGAPLLNNQYIHYRLAELKTEVEMLRAALYRATDSFVAGQDVTMMASMVKLKAGRLCREVTDNCLQFWGGMGYTNEVHVSRFFRDLRLTSIGGGSDETMLAIICKMMGTLPKPNKKG